MNENAWDNFDHCYVITTTGSEYAPKIRADLQRVGLHKIDLWTFTPLIRGHNDGGDTYNIWNFLIFGSNPDPISVDISKSHLKIIQDAYNKGYQKIVIFEDDARFDTETSVNKKIERSIEWLNKNPWDIFYFGCVTFPPFFNKHVTDDIDKVVFPMGSHAYAISRSGMIKVLADSCKITDEYVPIDTYYRNNFNLDKYMIYPSINNQCRPPAIYQRTACLIGLDYLIDYYQCCRLFEILSHYSHVIFLAIFVIIFMVIVKQIEKLHQNKR